jgi:hypothetical protein
VVDDDFTGDIVIATTVAAGDQSGARLWHTLKYYGNWKVLVL